MENSKKSKNRKKKILKEDIARSLGVSKRTVYNYEKSGKLNEKTEIRLQVQLYLSKLFSILNDFDWESLPSEKRGELAVELGKRAIEILR